MIKNIFFISRFATCVCALAFCIGAFPASAQKSTPVYSFRLRNGNTLYPQANARPWLDSMKQKGWSRGPVQAIVQFEQTLDSLQLKSLQNQGIALQEALSGNTYTALISKQAGSGNLSVMPLSITPVNSSWKILPFPDATKQGNMAEVLIAFNSGITLTEVQEQMARFGGKLLNSPLAAHQCYEAILPKDKLLDFAGWYGVKSIGPAAHDQELNFPSVIATKSNTAQLPVLSGGYGLLGDGMTVGIGDNTSGVNHVDLRDRIINYNPAPYSNHGIHVNGTVGGAGTLTPRTQGFAPHATIVDHLYNLVWARTGTMLQNHNMTVTNNSYAAIVGDCNYSGVYDAYAQALDTLALQYPTVLHVFASGNDGWLYCPQYVNGYGNVTGGYQPAKNVLVVSQSDKYYVWGINSSRGPVKDGRLKPEITAIGTNVTSTRGGDNYLTTGGTSMACPMVSGAAALLQQRYKQLHANANAPSDLMKTLLMNGTMDIGNVGPDYTFGFGMMDLSRSLLMLDSNHYTSNTIANGAQQTININVPANTAQVKVMLYWHDRPASILSGKELVNDLDLEVTSPANVTTLPLILDPTPANVDRVAVPGVDHLNNVEQVTLNNPGAGTYTIKVKGYDITAPGQAYVIAYDFIKTGIELTYPTKGAVLDGVDSVHVTWNASPDTRAFTFEVSTDNGTTWTIIDNNIPADRRWYGWFPGGLSSNQCMVRVSRNGTTQVATTAGPFVASPSQGLALNTVQCPGYMSIFWHPVPGATGYQIQRKKGPYLENEVIITDTTYTFSGLSLDSTYYASVIPLISGTPGYRFIGISRIPNTGTCTGSISDGDLMAQQIESPSSGRLLTTTQLGASENIVLRVRNLDDVAATNYRVAYSINGGSWQSQVITTTIPANSSSLITIPAGLNLSAAGTYLLRIAVKNLATTDAVTSNDTINKVIRQLNNAQVNFATGFTDGFETSTALSLQRDSLGFTPNEHWDFANSNDTGRLRTFINNDVLISGNRSISLDLYQYYNATTNFLTGTFNAAAYTIANEIRMQFNYKMHGASHFSDSNKLWVRGADTRPWVPLYSYNLNTTPGAINNSGSLSITDALVAAGQNYSSSTQLRFGQRDTTVIAMNDYGTGVTLDDISLYSVVNDIAVDSIITPKGASCNLITSPVSISIYNGVLQALTNIQVAYQLDNGAIVNGTIASLPGKTHLVYNFAQQLNAITAGAHRLKVWATAAGDSYHQNDTITNIFHHQPLVTSFPYLENFESGDGNYYSEGINNSWQYGTPVNGAVQNAASGTKAWKTNLSGYYNDNEQSYLYSPCFDLSGLTHPMLSFSGVLDIEDCGTSICDAAWVEYSNDGGNSWNKLGAYGQGYGWYDDSTAQIWSNQNNTRWTVRSIGLPLSTQPIELRFVLASDPGTAKNGFSIDDIHIFNHDYGVYSGLDAGPVTQTASGTQWINFVQNGNLLAQIKPDGQNLGSTQVNVYTHNAVDTASGQYYLPRSFMIQSAQQPTDSVTARLFVMDAEVDSLVSGTGCNTCTKPADVYRLGISKYDDTLLSNENGILSDNVSGIWKFYNTQKVKWVPYDSGYYAEVRVPSFSEFWFNDGGPQGNLSLPTYTLGTEKLLAVYPNPNTDGRITIAWTAGLERSIDVALTDLTGRTVKKAVLTSRNGKNIATLDAGTIARGVYFIKCSIGEQSFVQKIVFQ